MCTLMLGLELLVETATLASSIKQNQTKKEEGKYTAKLLEKQAKKAEFDAAYVRQEGIEEARRKKLNSILNMGKEKTTIAAGNIDLSSQMAINILDDEKLNGELDALTTLKKSENQANKYTEKASEYYSKAGLTSFKTKQEYQSNIIYSAGKTTKKIGELFIPQ